MYPIFGSFFLLLSFSQSQVVMKKSSYDTFIFQKEELGEKIIIWLEKDDVFSLIMLFHLKNWQLENKRKKKPEIPSPNNMYSLQSYFANKNTVFQTFLSDCKEICGCDSQIELNSFSISYTTIFPLCFVTWCTIKVILSTLA